MGTSNDRDMLKLTATLYINYFQSCYMLEYIKRLEMTGKELPFILEVTHLLFLNYV